MMRAIHVLSLNIGTGKWHAKNPSEKWRGLGGNFFRIFYLLLCFVLLFLFPFFDSYFVEILAAFNC